ncbi:hypothetical protein [Microbispora bryophytorum]|uniref:hypothetical protein n=1 Tax=Microbispora bryophytorum TaxID=1460882 RepID=UPI0033E7BB58
MSAGGPGCPELFDLVAARDLVGLLDALECALSRVDERNRRRPPDAWQFRPRDAERLRVALLAYVKTFGVPRPPGRDRSQVEFSHR